MASITNIPPNRVVALLTPTVFAPLAGAIAVAAAEYAPGTSIDETSLTAIFIAGATIAFGEAAQWTKGWQAREQRDAESALAAPAGEDFDAPADTDMFDELDGEDGLPAELAFDEELAAFEDAEELLALEEDEAIDEELLAMSTADEE